MSGATIEQPRPALHMMRSAECRCGTTENFPENIGPPAGWRVVEGGALCPDCVALEQQPTLIPAKAAKGGHHGCRVSHADVCAESVVMRIHAGAIGLGGPMVDRPIHFLMRKADLTELIEHLTAVRNSIPDRTKGASND